MRASVPQPEGELKLPLKRRRQRLWVLGVPRKTRSQAVGGSQGLWPEASIHQGGETELLALRGSRVDGSPDRPLLPVCDPLERKRFTVGRAPPAAQQLEARSSRPGRSYRTQAVPMLQCSAACCGRAGLQPGRKLRRPQKGNQHVVHQTVYDSNGCGPLGNETPASFTCHR